VYDPITTNNTATYAETPEGQQPLSVRDLADIIRKRLWIVILVPLVLVGTAVAFSFLQTPVYEASARVQVGLEPGVDAQQNMDGTIAGLQTLTHEIAAAGLTPSVAEEVIRGIEQQGVTQGVTQQDLNNSLTIEQVEDTRQLQISYSDADQEKAREVVNQVADAYDAQIPETSEVGTPITATVLNYATEPKVKGSDPVRNGLVALAIGLMLGIGFTFLLEFLNDKWRSPEEIEQVSGIPTFGVIPEFQAAENGKRKGRKRKGS
jgi:capsular polysaccharide biosynthesis protein